ncbi:hypothetical protein ACFV1N_45170 [Streptosporangium canum]|uniref:hypothetical protein n=1 Tax=Streptosporangium canum TaxID=324952 RepID=UPI0036AE6261
MAVTATLQTAQTKAIGKLPPLVGRRNACAAAGVPQANWYRRNRQSPTPARPVTPRKPRPAALSRAERDRIRAMLNERFADAAPATAYFTLLDEGTYLASESTMYQILREHGEGGPDRRVEPPILPLAWLNPGNFNQAILRSNVVE